MVHCPEVRKASEPADEIVHTFVVVDVNATASPELAAAEIVGVVPKFCAPGLVNVMVCARFGVTAVDADDALLEPTLLVAFTVKVYEVPFVRPDTVIGDPLPVDTMPSGLDVTRYDETVAPPSLAGGVKLTVAEPSPAAALTPVGASGTVAGAVVV